MITDIMDHAAERIGDVVYSELADARSEIEGIANGIDDAIDTLEAFQDEPDADERIADAIAILRRLR